MDTRKDAIYARQSVEKDSSISIETQVEFCEYELHGGRHRTYADKGFSGKNSKRPALQRLLEDVAAGEIRRIVVYRLDRISRSVMDFAQILQLLQRCDVEFVSATERFDTSTPMGRAMLHICMVFAQLERETIQQRCRDTAYSKRAAGIPPSGPPAYGFQVQTTKVNGVETRCYVADPVNAEVVRYLFELYAKPGFGYGDVVRHLVKLGIQVNGQYLMRSGLAALLRNPIYVRADRRIYDYYQERGITIHSEPSEFHGETGCYLYRGRDAEKHDSPTELRIAPHKGIVPADLWLYCQKKMQRRAIDLAGARKASHTWLSGKIKCGNCGRALISAVTYAQQPRLVCTLQRDNSSCPGCGLVQTADLEDMVYQQMCARIQSLNLEQERHVPAEQLGEVHTLQAAMAETEAEIDHLIGNLAGASSAVMAYANEKIAVLDDRYQSQQDELNVLLENEPSHVLHLADLLDQWGQLEFAQKREVLDALVTNISAKEGQIEILWKL